MPFPVAYAERPKEVTIPIHGKYAQRTPLRKRSAGDALLKAGLPAAGTTQTGDSFRGKARKPLPHDRHAGTLLTGGGRSRYKTKRRFRKTVRIPLSGKCCPSPCHGPLPSFPEANPAPPPFREWKGHPIPSTALSGCAGPKALSERAAHLPCGQTPQDGPKGPTVRQTARGCEEKHARQTPRQAGKGLILWDGGLTGHGGGVPLPAP